MKKILVAIISVAMLFTLTACSKAKTNVETSATHEPSKMTASEIVEENDDLKIVTCTVEDQCATSNFKFTFNKKKLIKAEAFTKITGMKKLFQQAQVELENVDREPYDYFESLEFDVDAQTINMTYNKNGMKAAQFTDKTPEELKAFMDDFINGKVAPLTEEEIDAIFIKPTPVPNDVPAVEATVEPTVEP